MGKVYDPIHDVFQDQRDTDVNPMLEETHEVEDMDQESGNDSTESEDNTNILSNFEPSMVPSVTTNKKMMKESSKYNRHLKKPDGEFFTRADLQFCFLQQLLADDRKLFTNIFKDVYAKSIVPVPPPPGVTLNVTDAEYDAKTFVFDDKLTFSQLYVLALASSTKCSKVLRDKLLFDQQAAFSTCILGLLVNIGRLNTTINFYLEMTSQLRTFHSVPCLQLRATDLKSLQDTPRLKSILKSLPVGNETLDLSKMYETPGPSRKVRDPLNVVNLLFTMCDNVTLVNLKLMHRFVETGGNPISLFNILDCPGYEPKDRCNVVLWLLYIHLETDMSETSVAAAVKHFTEEDRIPLTPTDTDYDEDPPDEYQFGLEQRTKRKEFLQRIHAGEAPPNEGHDGEQEHDSEHDHEHGGDKEQERKEDGKLKFSTPDNRLSATEPSSSPAENATAEQEEAQTHEVDIKPKQTPVRTQTPMKEEDADPSHRKSRSRKREARREPKRDPKPNVKRRKTEPPEDRRNEVESEDRIDQLISADKAKLVGHALGKPRTQDQFLSDLRSAHLPVAHKRHDLGLLKIFSEYEDIPMASVIGIRGKKRKKFRDGVLGFETDFLHNFAAAKRIMLRKEHNANRLFEPFHL
ncbi:ZYBA0S09-00386g1_1 [Zygosaccharomyces bailii CLIB 213]|uniref:ZYBA0S09-00386g1_1 n=1 Tax=Zygosaccharomyces bailii (strain CLIB 213 / ATCC 58445 / CBS 680 / BCRC 21525 / NBRC 1098 / NCYC 1416 / NRRL Y-2227) TaxID=1333698 RepID=A0A8J2T9P3_ZYGB2|nr:ZYBA0S09-00386g1_1 [Zygosaccharomyces bailii CLIB 213]